MTVPGDKPISLRAATPQDAPAIVKLGRHVFTTCFGYSVTPEQLRTYLDEAYTVEAIAKDIVNTNKSTILAINDDDGTLAGFTLLTRGTTEPCVDHLESKIELQRIYVDIGLHGSGVGKMLGAEAQRLAAEQGFKHMWLGVWEQNFKAQKVYGKMGFRVVGDHKFDVGGDIQTDLIMVKEL